MDALREEFGEDNVINCATFGTCSSKSSLQSACRGLGIDNDISAYISSLIPIDRGSLWTLEECFYGNPDKDKKPVTEFIKEVSKYEGLKEIALEFEGLIDKRGQHASAVYIFNNGINSHNCMMKSSNGTPTTQFSMAHSDYMSALKLDILWTEAQAKLQTCLELLIKDKVIEDKGSLRENYNTYLHPDRIDQTSEGIWESAYNGEVLDLFQYSTQLGIEALKKVKPRNLVEATATNSLMRLMGDSDIMPIDKYIANKNDINNWYKELKEYNLTKDEIKLLEQYLLADYGVANVQETLMEVVMAVGCTMEEANKCRKTIAKKVFRDIDKLKELLFEVGTRSGYSNNLLNYVWEQVILPQAG